MRMIAMRKYIQDGKAGIQRPFLMLAAETPFADACAMVDEPYFFLPIAAASARGFETPGRLASLLARRSNADTDCSFFG